MRMVALLLTAVMLLTACNATPVEKGGTTDKTEQSSGTESNDKAKVPDVPKVCLLITGTLGDRAYMDSANAGLTRLQKDLGDKVETKVVELGIDQTKYEPGLRQVSNEDYDVIVVLGWIVVEHLQTIAPEHPDKTYIIMDSTVDYSAGDCNNVYSVEYKSNEASFLAGALAAKMTSSGEEGYNDKAVIGTVGAMDIPVINDFLVGYFEGAMHVNPEIKSQISYIGNFDDSAKAKELGLKQFSSGADILFSVSSAASIGVIDAAYDAKQHVIGVDSDQAMLIAETAPEKAACIPTSVLKNTGNTLYDSILLYIDGKLPVGTRVMHGLKEGAVGLAKNKYYEEQVPQEIRDYIEELEQKLINGDITVTSAYGMDQSTLDEIRNNIKP